MATSEDRWRTFVEAYDIEVPEERIEEEYRFIRADIKHRMVYDQMGGGEIHFFPDAELDQQEDELRAAAIFEAKEPLVLRDLAKKLDVEVTHDELLAEAEAIAQRQNTPLDGLKRFFGDDFALLERDVREAKIRKWACDRQLPE